MQSDRNKYEKIKKIGEGAYGAVYKARHNTSKQIVALKITKFDLDDEGIPSTALRQISILKSLDHPNIVKLLDVQYFTVNQQFFLQLVFEYMEEDLGKYIKRKNQQIKEYECRQIFKSILTGVKYLSERNVLHRDLKPQNILINSKNQIKIADFGLSRVIINHDKTYSKQIQTLWYRSPQLMLGIKHYGKGVDQWSLGCILYELFEGKVLFRGDSEVTQIFLIFETLGTPRIESWPQVVSLPHFKKTFPKMRGKIIQFKRLNECGIDLLMKLIEPNPKNRIGIIQALGHQFLRNI